jgi:hypothetical protein
MASTARILLGFFVGLLIWLWAKTYRRRVIVNPALQRQLRQAPPSTVYAFWHGQQLALAGLGARPTAVLVSWSKDGTLQSGVMRALGLSVVRGSSSRGGAVGLRRLLAEMANGKDLAFAVDGPRGPRAHPKPGAAFAAKKAGARLVPIAAAASPQLRLPRTWDDFRLPLPFSRVTVIMGAPVDAERALAEPQLLRDALNRAATQAELSTRR